MRFGEAGTGELVSAAQNEGLRFQAGPFVILLRSEAAGLVEVFQQLYRDFQWLAAEGVSDFHVSLLRARGVRRIWRPQVRFRLDRDEPFEPFPLDHAFPLFEWGLNYGIATRAHRYCQLHSAVVEKEGRALVLPAMPGSGKSTLCAALMQRGWRLLSDEFGIVQPESGQLLPMPRAIPLKNRSIEVIRRFAPDARLGPRFPKTRKGDVAHLAPTTESVLRQQEPARPAWIVFPRYEEGAGNRLQPVARSEAFVRLSNNAFNYRLTGETGFRTLTAMVRQCECLEYRYSDLEQAVATMNRLVG